MSNPVRSVKVRDNYHARDNGGAPREIVLPEKAYQARKNRYTFVAYVNEDGSQIQQAPKPTPQPIQSQPAQESENAGAAVVESDAPAPKKRGPKPKTQAV